MQRLVDYSDEELARALHWVDGHEDCLEGLEATGWFRIKRLLLRVAAEQRELDQD